MSRLVVLMRGLPGSGKSTAAKRILQQAIDGSQNNTCTGLILSTDDYFVDPQTKEYRFDRGLLGQAHEWNLSRFRHSLGEGKSPIIVDNTNVSLWEMRPYVEDALEFQYAIQVAEPETEWWLRRDAETMARMNTHQVAHDIIENMLRRWEPFVDLESILRAERPVFKRSSSSRTAPSSTTSVRICQYHRRGMCRFGTACRDLHQ